MPGITVAAFSCQLRVEEMAMLIISYNIRNLGTLKNGMYFISFPFLQGYIYFSVPKGDIFYTLEYSEKINQD